jgi:NAD(P)-dependent dehydrogenase (short-subunit alcohol dehydrogenase family)
MLQHKGFAVTVVGRDTAHGEKAVHRIGEGARFLQADLSSIREVRGLGARLAGEGPLHLLVNNVGGQYSKRWTTADGIEASFAVNHLGPVVLTRELLGALQAGAPSRIVDVTSSSITILDGAPNYDELEQDGDYFGMAVTGRAKLAHLAHTQDLSRRLEGSGLTVLSVDPVGPAAAATPNAAAMTPELLPPPIRHLWGQIQAGIRPVEECAEIIVAAATDPAFEGKTGVVVGPDGQPSENLKSYLNPEVAAASRALTERVLAGLDRGDGTGPLT